jgi:hypothetical protein
MDCFAVLRSHIEQGVLTRATSQHACSAWDGTALAASYREIGLSPSATIAGATSPVYSPARTDHHRAVPFVPVRGERCASHP